MIGTSIGNSLIWDNGTNVGIGNTNTSYTLDVSGTGRFTGALTSAGLTLTTAGSTSAIISGTGTNVYSSLSLTNTTTGYGYDIGFGGSASIAPNSFYIYGGSSASVKFLINSAGNVGIGTASPSGPLHLSYSSAVYDGMFFTDTRATSSSGTWRIGAGTGGVGFGIYSNSLGTTPFFISNSSGNVGIGESAPSAKLQIIGIDATSSNSNIFSQNSVGTTLFRLRNDGLFFTGTASGSPYNNTYGNVANTYIGSDGAMGRSTASSQRFKENINEWSGNGLDTILALKPKTFTYKADYYKHPNVNFLGLIAEEVAEVSEYLADFENEDRTGEVENVRYANIVVPLIAAIKEQQAQIEELSNRLIKLESK
jgi:hypothetical protein